MAELDDVKAALVDAGVSAAAMRELQPYLGAFVASKATDVLKLAENIKTFELGAEFSDMVIAASKTEVSMLRFIFTVRAYLESDKFLDGGAFFLNCLNHDPHGLIDTKCVQTAMPGVVMFREEDSPVWVAGVPQRELDDLWKETGMDDDDHDHHDHDSWSR